MRVWRLPDAEMLMAGASCCVEGFVTAKAIAYVTPARTVFPAHTGRTSALFPHPPLFIVRAVESPQKSTPALTQLVPEKRVTASKGYSKAVTPVRPERVMIDSRSPEEEDAREMLPLMSSVRVLDTETKGLDCESFLVDHSTATTCTEAGSS